MEWQAAFVLGLILLAMFGAGLWTIGQWCYLRLSQLLSWVNNLEFEVLCVLGLVVAVAALAAFAVYSTQDVALTPAELRTKAYDCLDYKLLPQVSRFNSEGKPAAVVCVLQPQAEVVDDNPSMRTKQL